MVRVSESHSVALYGFYHLIYSAILGNDLRLQHISHFLESFVFRFSHALHRNTGHSADYVGHFSLANQCAVARVSVFPFLSDNLNVLLLLGLAVAQGSRHLEILASHGSLFLGDNLVEFFLCLNQFFRNGGRIDMDM